ncbi:MAG: hypothetical protein WCG92_18605 [Hyphomicrobiales bacterium]
MPSSKLVRLLVTALSVAGAGLVCAPVAYMLWPAPVAVSPDAPSLPITIGGMAFNVPPAAIRFKVQRRPGAQPRVDLSFVWPALTPPDLSIKPSPTDTPDITDRLFVTIAGSDITLSPGERLKVIYPRYADAAPIVGGDGLSLQGFRDGSPYQGEDLILQPAAPERFLLRCTRQIAATPAMCLHERRLGGADVTVRFPRAWLDNWSPVADGIDRLIAGFRPTPVPG